MTEIDIAQILRRIPLLKSVPYDEIAIKPLSGLSNLNFQLRYRQHEYILRVPKTETSHSIDRSTEAFNEDQVIRTGMAPEVIWRQDSGISLCQYIQSSRTLSAADLKNDSIILSLVECLRSLHSPDIRFNGQTDIDRLLREHFDLMPTNKQRQLSASFEKALRIFRLISQTDNRLVASHNDLVLENILIDEERKLWFIDWEYSSLSSPYWDIATLCNNARLEQQHCRHLLSLYSNMIDVLRLENLYGYQYILQLLTISWLVVYTTRPVEAEIDWLARLERSAIQI